MVEKGKTTMSSPGLIRAGGIAATLAGALGIVAAPITTSAYFLAGEGPSPPWQPVIGELFAPLLTFASPEAVYATYGKLYFLVFLGLLAGLAALGALGSERRGTRGSLERWGFRLAFAGLSLNLLGNLADYWYRGGFGDSALDFLGFVLGTLLGLLLLISGSTILGIALLRAGAAPRLGAWLLVLALPGIVLLSFLGFGNIPSGPALWFCFAWIALGYALWSRNTADYIADFNPPSGRKVS